MFTNANTAAADLILLISLLEFRLITIKPLLQILKGLVNYNLLSKLRSHRKYVVNLSCFKCLLR